MNNNYYTYAFLRKNGSPYYIGKGMNKRLYSKKGRTISIPKDKSRIIYLKQNLTEEEAFRHEIYMISVLGRKDLGTGILRNLTNGGEGGSGSIRKDLATYNSTVKKGSTLTESHVLKIQESLLGRGSMPHMEENGRKNITGFHNRRREDSSLNEGFIETCRENGRRHGGENGKRNKGRKHSSEVNSKKGSPGEKNPMFGKVRITNGMVNKQINPEDPVPEGFRPGLTRFKK